jgi:cytochrome c oxidase subunit III
LATNQAAITDRHNDDQHQQDPALLHHFATKEQQKNSASLGMWLFLAQEVMFFGGMFCAYLVYRYRYFGDFGSASQTLNIWYGAINTVVLLCSSLTVVLAVRAAQLNKRKALTMWLILTIVLGLAFLGIKGIEYAEKFADHHVPGSTFAYHGTVPSHPDQQVNPHHAEMYFSLYFAMTGMHALHMIIGVGLFSTLAWWAWRGKYSSNYYTPIENAGLYWHFVDVVWIYLFPLLYLIDRKK